MGLSDGEETAARLQHTFLSSRLQLDCAICERLVYSVREATEYERQCSVQDEGFHRFGNNIEVNGIAQICDYHGEVVALFRHAGAASDAKIALQ